MKNLKSGIPYGTHQITDGDIQAVIEVLMSNFLTQGPKIQEFEKAFAEYIGSKFAVAVANGTAALHLCTLALGVKPGNKVITSSITFAASANCVRFCGGEVIFADIDPDTYLLDIKAVSKLLKSSPKGTYQGIITVDFTGRPIDMEAFHNLANEHECWVIEDACHAPGGYFVDSKGEKQNCGNGRFADLAIFSFHPVKHIATGEGGMITTNDEQLYRHLLKLRTHGISRDSNDFTNSQSFAAGSAPGENSGWPGWYMEMQELGYNYRMTDFQAALGISQLKRAETTLAARKAIAKRYCEAFQTHPGINVQSNEIEGHAFHLFVIEIDDRLGLYNHLRKHNIFTQVHYIPCHLMPYYRSFGWKEGDLPDSENYYKKCLSLPMYPTLTVDEQKYIINEIFSYLILSGNEYIH
jgi:UDP-4-amino-4,6-dideoxy-N-acetyl-beta-L-altrosamine transaminase